MMLFLVLSVVRYLETLHVCIVEHLFKKEKNGKTSKKKGATGIKT